MTATTPSPRHAGRPHEVHDGKQSALTSALLELREALGFIVGGATCHSRTRSALQTTAPGSTVRP